MTHIDVHCFLTCVFSRHQVLTTHYHKNSFLAHAIRKSNNLWLLYKKVMKTAHIYYVVFLYLFCGPSMKLYEFSPASNPVSSATKSSIIRSIQATPRNVLPVPPGRVAWMGRHADITIPKVWTNLVLILYHIKF